MTVICPICGKENELRAYSQSWNKICTGYSGALENCQLYKGVEKEIYWCFPLFGQQEVPVEEFDRWLKLRAFQ